MIILDEPYASVPLLDWMEASAHPVLANEFTEKLTAGGRALNLVDAAECARRLEAGERIYTNSENALAWILDHVDNPTLTDAIRLFKDKAAMREKLAPLKSGPVPQNRRSCGAGSGERRRLAVAGGVETLRGILLDGRLRY